jgi:uncharacterized membrane protein YuzA (DUF378 family)
MTNLTIIDWIALALVIVGALNWGLMGLAKFNLVETLFGEDSPLARLVYVLVGVAGIYVIYFATIVGRK